MAKIVPFKALRYNFEKAGKPEDICCPPYDIISEEEREALLKKEEHNVIRLEYPKGENRYEDAAKTLIEWQKNGILTVDEEDSLYIYEEEFEARGKILKIYGIIARVFLEEFSKGVVLPHEETLAKAKADRFSLMSHTFCNFSQVYSLYMDPSGVIRSGVDSVRAEKPEIEFTMADGITHRLWMMKKSEQTDRICAAFESLKLFIADGHHRYQTAIDFRDSLMEKGACPEGAKYVMMMLVDMESDGLVVFPTHRLIRDLPGFDAETFLEKAARSFKITEIKGLDSIESELAKRSMSVAFYGGGDTYRILTLKEEGAVKRALPGMSDAYCSLDVSLLHSVVLEPMLGIDKKNMADQKNLTYTRSVDEAISEVKTGKSQCAFFLNPTKVTQIKDVSLAGEKMPQKSTYFYPKLITGLVMNKLAELPE